MLYSKEIVGELGNRLRMRRQTLEPDLGNSSGGNHEIYSNLLKITVLTSLDCVFVDKLFKRQRRSIWKSNEAELS